MPMLEHRLMRALLGVIAAFAAVPAGAATTFSLFATVETPSSPSGRFDTLVTVDPVTGAQTLVGTASAAVSLSQMDADPLSGRIVASDFFNNAGTLYSVDAVSGAVSVAGTLATNVRAVAFDPGGGLWGVDSTNSITGHVLGRIDLDAGSFSPVVTFASGRSVNAMDFAPDGTLYTIWNSGPGQQFLSTVDVDSQSIVDQALLATFTAGDMDFAPDGFIYHSNFSGTLIRVDPSAPAQLRVGAGSVGAAGGLVSVVPIPAPFFLLGGGCGLLAALLRRRPERTAARA